MIQLYYAGCLSKLNPDMKNKNRNSYVELMLSAVLVLAPLAARGQAGFAVDVLMSNACVSQNWDTPKTQDWLNKMPRAQRMQIYSGLRFPPNLKRCLMEHKPVQIELCDKVIDNFVTFSQQGIIGGAPPFQKISSEEENTIGDSLEKSHCLNEAASEGNDGWLPDDLKPTQATLDLLKRAENGDITAQLAAIDLYSLGEEVPTDEQRANYWRTKAALNGDVSSQYELADEFQAGRSQPLNFQEAIRFYTLAVNQGHLDSMRALGMLYQRNEPEYGESHLKKNPGQAIYWLSRAAELGDGVSARFLAQMYEGGENIPEDLAKAFFWYREGAKNLDAGSMVKLSEFYQTGRAGTRNPAEAQKWRRKADSLGENGTTIYLSDYFPWGKFPDNSAEEFEIQMRHAKEGDVDAQLAIAQRYFNGRGVKKDVAASASWWRKAAQGGDPIGQRMLGKSLIYGWGLPSEKPDASGTVWLKKAAEQQDTEAQVTLGHWYRSLKTTDPEEKKRNAIEAVRWLRIAADHGREPEILRNVASKWEKE